MSSENFNHGCWYEVMHDLGVSEELSGLWWQKIAAHYNEKSRYYHTHDHIQDMLMLLDESRKEVLRLDLMRLSIFFHDVIYYPTSSTNEENSAIMYSEFAMAIGQPKSDSCQVQDFILATKSHKQGAILLDDLKIFLDLDLSVLGRDKEDYMVYAHQIRKEYEHVPHSEYCAKRADVLRSFCARDFLYHTDHFRNKIEQKARENIAAEISLLDVGIVPTYSNYTSSLSV